MPNQPKKHRKKANHDIWNARIGAVLKSSSAIASALHRVSIPLSSAPLSCVFSRLVKIFHVEHHDAVLHLRAERPDRGSRGMAGPLDVARFEANAPVVK